MHLRQLVLVCCIFVASCGGGGGTVGIDGSGSKVDVSESGAINGFGSVIVNGVHYNTDDAQVFIRGELAEESDLNVGDFVVVIGHTNEGGESIADKVYYQPLATGRIDHLDLEKNTVTVLGQTIILLVDTTFSETVIPRNIEGLKVGQSITVSGVYDDNQNIRATRVQLTSSNQLDLLGKVESYNPYDYTYKVNGISIAVDNIPNTAFHKIGEWVTVVGDEYKNGIFHALSFTEAMDYRQLETVKTIKINGFVRELKENGNFYVDRVPVKVKENTVFVGGTASDLAKNSSLQVEGSLDAYYMLEADIISFKPVPNTQVFGQITNIQPAKIGAGYLGTIDLQGSTFKIDFGTRLVGDREKRISFFDLREWDTVMISGFYKNDKYIASSVTVDNRVFEKYVVEMQGWVASAMPSFKSFNLFNTQIKVNEDTKFTDSGLKISEAYCFELLAMGRMVQVRGYYSGYNLIATSVQLNPWFGGYLPPPPPPPPQLVM